MIRTNLYESTESHKIVAHKGRFSVVEYEKDLSVSPEMAQVSYYASQMNIRKRQIIARLTDLDGIIVQAGAMQLLLGSVEVTTNVRGAGDLMKKLIGSVVTDETAIKPHYIGEGTIVLEPTFRYILLQDLDDWNGAVVMEDGMFLACDDTADIKVTGRKTLSSAVLGGEGLFNTTIIGEGIVVMESPVPEDELIQVELEDDEIRIDGNMAIAWSQELEFTVEKTTGTLIGSAASKEGFVNVYRGTGKILIAPVERNRNITAPKDERL